jgi:hypothetical protein
MVTTIPLIELVRHIYQVLVPKRSSLGHELTLPDIYDASMPCGSVETIETPVGYVPHHQTSRLMGELLDKSLRARVTGFDNRSATWVTLRPSFTSKTIVWVADEEIIRRWDLRLNLPVVELRNSSSSSS